MGSDELHDYGAHKVSGKQGSLLSGEGPEQVRFVGRPTDGWADDRTGGTMKVSAGTQVSGLRKMGDSPETTSQDPPRAHRSPRQGLRMPAEDITGAKILQSHTAGK